MAQEVQWQESGSGLSFSLRTLLIAIAALAIAFAGFRIGYDQGYSRGQEQYNSEVGYPVVYDVGDVLEKAPNGGLGYDSLIDSLVSTVQPTSWSETGGPGAVQPLTCSDQLIVSQSRSVHEQVRKFLESRRFSQPAKNDSSGAAAKAN